MNLKRFPHMAIECIPLPISAGETAPIYFKVSNNLLIHYERNSTIIMARHSLVVLYLIKRIDNEIITRFTLF